MYFPTAVPDWGTGDLPARNSLDAIASIRSWARIGSGSIKITCTVASVDLISDTLTNIWLSRARMKFRRQML
jgi:hypothetical protein